MGFPKTNVFWEFWGFFVGEVGTFYFTSPCIKFQSILSCKCSEYLSKITTTIDSETSLFTYFVYIDRSGLWIPIPLQSILEQPKLFYNLVFKVIQFIEDNHRLDKPDACPDVTYAEMTKCWLAKPENRPTFSDLYHHFETAQEYASIKDIKRSHKESKRKR